MENLRYIYVLGYGWSGSSAVVDLLREFKDVYVPDIEFRLFKERYGIMDLEDAIVRHFDPMETDLAIKDFLWLCGKLNAVPTRWCPGLSYSTKLGANFMDQVKLYIGKLTKFQFESLWYFNIWKLGGYRYYLYKRLKCFRLRREYKEVINVAKIVSEDDFRKETSNLIDSIFEPICTQNKAKYIVLDQGVPVQFPEYGFRYTDNSKVIVVDRDPRDMYFDLVMQGALIGQTLAIKDDVSLFVDWFKSWHFRSKEIGSNTAILSLRFEDVILDYEAITKQICDYLGFDSLHQFRKGQFLDITKSSKNIGMWKQYKNQAVMEEIGKQLSEYCYEYRM